MHITTLLDTIFFLLLVNFDMGTNEATPEVCDKPNQDCTEKQLTAILLGGTGATGRKVLNELNSSDKITKIIFITRRPLEFPDMPKVSIFTIRK